MARQPSLRSQLNQIRAWVRQGRTNAWIAHQLDITPDQVERFKQEHQLDSAEPAATKAIDPLSIPVPDVPDRPDEDEDEDEDDEPEGESERSGSSRGGQRRGSRGGRGSRSGSSGSGGSRSGGSRSGSSRSGSSRSDRDRSPRQSRGKGDDRERGGEDRQKRSRGRRGGRRRGKIPTYEATFDHGEEGYGLWLDPAVVDNPVYLKHWAGQRAIEVKLDPDSITIRRADVSGEPESKNGSA